MCNNRSGSIIEAIKYFRIEEGATPFKYGKGFYWGLLQAL